MPKIYRLILIGLVLFGLAFGLVGATNTASASSPLVHIVGWGDTLFSIANRYGTSVNAIMQANRLSNPNFIYIGQRLSIPTGSVPVPPPSTGTYVVQAGDTLFSIATRNNTTVAELMQANGLYNYWIYVGQTLRIPGRYAPPPMPNPPPAPQGVYHIVRPGEWLSLIAARYGSSVYAIQIANNLANPSLLWVGQRLFIPGGIAPVIMPGYVYQPPILVPPVKPPVVILPPASSASSSSVPVVVLPPASSSSATPNALSGTWEAVLLVNTTGTGPCSLGVFVKGRTNWPVVVATPDGSWISDPKTTGDKPERGSDYVEFAHACTGVWRVIPLGLNIYADVELKGGHAEIEFHQRP